MASSICAALFSVSALPTNAAQPNEELKAKSSLMWTAGMGFSYPLVVSVSDGVIAPISERKTDSPYGFPGVPAIHANLDLGVGGGMISGGLSFPLNVGYSSGTISLKGAALRTWLVDVGQERNRTFTGGVMEFLIPSHPDGKLGIGYFRESEPADSSHDHFIFLYFG